MNSVKEYLPAQLEEIRAAGTYKRERVITTPQNAHIRVGDGEPVLSLCANNYLGLAEHPAILKAAHEALDRWGYGLSYVIGFSYPVVPQGKARVRTQISAAHSESDLTFAIQRFAEVKPELGL